MEFGNINVSINTQDINYTEAKFSRMIIREVYKNGVPNGIYHIKPKNNIKTAFLLEFLKKELPILLDVDLMDPEGELNLEYPIYLNSNMNRSDLIITFQSVDAKLDKFIKNHKNLN